MKFKITILPDAGASRSNGKPAPIVASHGRVFFVYASSLEEARERFKRGGLPMRDPRTPAVPEIFDDDFSIDVATAEDEKVVLVENYSKAKP